MIGVLRTAWCRLEHCADSKVFDLLIVFLCSAIYFCFILTFHGIFPNQYFDKYDDEWILVFFIFFSIFDDSRAQQEDIISVIFLDKLNK